MGHFPTGNLVMRMYDERGMLFLERDFNDLFPIQGQPAEAPRPVSGSLVQLRRVQRNRTSPWEFALPLHVFLDRLTI